jgi:hypothetical protein
MNPLYHSNEEIEEKIECLKMQLHPEGEGDVGLAEDQQLLIKQEIEELEAWL